MTLTVARRRSAFEGGGYDDDVSKLNSSSVKPIRPRKWRNRWLSEVKAFPKILGLLGFIISVYLWWWLRNSGGSNIFNVELVEKFVKTIPMLQVQLNELDKKLEDLISSVRKMERNGEEADLKLKALDAKTDLLEKKKFMDGVMTKEEFGDFVENSKNANKNRGMDRDEIIGLVREIVEKEIGTESLLTKEEFGEFVEEFKKARKQIIGYAAEIVEKEIERHAADGLGMVDYAMASTGSMVVDHSKPDGRCVKNEYRVCKIAEKMITPSFGEPGQCFPLDGEKGFVEIRLRDIIVVEVVTLEHVAKSVDFTRISAPKQCRVSGWLHGPNFYGKVDDDKKFLLAEFTYDLEKKNVQTYKVVESAASKLVDTIRLDFTSNHGGSYTCIYRLRVHDRLAEPMSQ